MRLLASLLLAVALAAPFGDAGAFSLAAAGACPGGDSARVEGSWDGGAHGIGAGGVPAARRYLPPSLGATSGEGLGGSEAPVRAGLASRHGAAASGTPRPAVTAAGRAPLPGGSSTFLLGFPAHPSTAPPLRG